MKIVHKYSEVSNNTKFLPYPKIKPPRRNPSYMNKSLQEGYMKEYMKEYRKEKGLQHKMPENLKRLRRIYRKRLRERFFK